MELLRLCQELHGAMEYCHGVGVRLAPLMEREHGMGLEVLRRLKQCLDPQGILNPGKLDLVPAPTPEPATGA
jgi:FAD/FMN-containing dehydrogenase